MNDSQFAEFRAAVFGMLSALQVALRAVVKTHPQPQALREAFQREHEEALSVLATKPLPSAAFDAYWEVVRGIAPNPDDWLES